MRFFFDLFESRDGIEQARTENVMSQGYSQDNLPELTDQIVTDAFIEMINDYVKSARRKGVQVVFSYCPLNVLSVEHCGKEEMQAFARKLEKNLDCRILAPLEDHIIDEGFFYDSNYHLNDIGAQYYSLRLVSNVQRILGNMEKTSVSLPHPPEFVNENKVLSSGNEQGILYDVTLNGCLITGLDEGGRALSHLMIPQEIAGVPVVSVSAKAFASSDAKTIVLPKTIEHLSGSLFNDAKNLKKVELYASQLPEVSEELFKGANPDVILYVPDEMYGTYITDYFWGVNADRMKPIQ